MKSTPLLPTEYNSYFKGYLDKVTTTTLMDSLQLGMDRTVALFESIPAEREDYRYKEGKWTPRDILQHIIDTERVFTYRALQFARATDVVLQGFDQNEFAANSCANSRTLKDMLVEYRSVRKSTLQFAKSCSQDILVRRGVVDDSPLSVRAALYIVCGHEIHHCEIIRERYL